jgi:predicted HTH transcriptional regulator
MSAVTKDELYRLIETQRVERKRSLSEKREGLESVNAMVNADSASGQILFGVAPNGTVVGIEPGDADKAQRSLAQHIRDKFDPPIRFEIQAVDCEGKDGLAVSARREPHVPLCEYNGRAYIREGSEKRQLKLAEKLHIIRCRDRGQHTGPWKCSKCGAFTGQLISVVFDGQRMERDYGCRCGGEYWPAT